MSKEFTISNDISWLASSTANLPSTFLPTNPWISCKPKAAETNTCNREPWEPTTDLSHVCRNLNSSWPTVKPNYSKDTEFTFEGASLKDRPIESLSYFDSNKPCLDLSQNVSYPDISENHGVMNNMWLQSKVVKGDKSVTCSSNFNLDVFKTNLTTTAADNLDYQKPSLINQLISSLNNDKFSNEICSPMSPFIPNHPSGRSLQGMNNESALQGIKSENAVMGIKNDTYLSFSPSDTYSPPSSSSNSPRQNTDLIALMQELALVNSEEDSLRVWLARQNLSTPFQSPPLTPSTTPTKGCVFCKNNNYHSTFYKSHVLKDDRGHCQCPVLRTYVCPLCGGTGDSAHTLKYCPHNTVTRGDPIAAGLPPGKVTNWREVASKMTNYHKI